MAYSIVLGSLALGCLIEIAWAVVPTWRRRTTARWIKRQHLPVAVGLEGAIESAHAGRVLAQGLGGLVGLGLGLVFLLTPATAGAPPMDEWLLIASTLGGIAAGLGAHGFRAALPLPAGSTRVAHATDQTVVKLLGAPLLHLARATAALGVVSAVFVVVFPVGPAAGLPWSFRNAVLVGLAVLAVVWLTSEVLAARLVHRPQPAGSAAELAWHDILRAEVVRDLYVLPGTLSLFLAMLAVLQQESGAGDPLPLPLALLPMVLMNLILFAMVGQVALHAGATPPTRRWRKVLATGPGVGIG